MVDDDSEAVKRRETIVVVSGLPRSGTSMLMQMLEAAGLPILQDGLRAGDASNPRGYYEFDPVKRIRSDNSFLAEATGHAVKIVAPLLPALPPDFHYSVVFIERDLKAVLASQSEMLARLGVSQEPAEDETLERAFEASLRTAKAWLADQENVQACYVSHAEAVESPGHTARAILDFLLTQSAIPPSLVEEIRQDRNRVIDRMSSVFDASLSHH